MKTRMNVAIRRNRQTPCGAPQGFTLLELLTVISIIGILASVAGPGLSNALQAAKANAAMQKARQIALGLRGFALDNGGAYPAGENSFGESITSSNAAFRDLYDYLEDESVFAVKGSNWGAAADNKMESGSDFVQAGENHFAYIAGLDTMSRSSGRRNSGAQERRRHCRVRHPATLGGSAAPSASARALSPPGARC